MFCSTASGFLQSTRSCVYVGGCVCTHAYCQAEILKSATAAAAKTPVCSGFSQITYSFIELLKDMKLLNYEADKNLNG